MKCFLSPKKASQVSHALISCESLSIFVITVISPLVNPLNLSFPPPLEMCFLINSHQIDDGGSLSEIILVREQMQINTQYSAFEKSDKHSSTIQYE